MVFFFFMLLVTGGILEAYRSEQKLTMSEFFQSGAACFWRFLRLLIMFLIVLATGGHSGVLYQQMVGPSF